MGNLIVRQKIPAFIITLGGSSFLKDCSGSSFTIPRFRSCKAGKPIFTRCSLRFICRQLLGYVLAALHRHCADLRKTSVAQGAPGYGFAVEDRELVFLKLFLAAQLIFSLRRSDKQIPRHPTISGHTRSDCFRYLCSHHAHAVRTLSLCDWRQRGSGRSFPVFRSRKWLSPRLA